MKKLQKTFKDRPDAWIVGFFLTIMSLLVVLACIAWIAIQFMEVKEDILDADLGDGYSIEFWSASDINTIHPSINYRIMRNDAEAVPATTLTYGEFNDTYDITVRYADDGNLVVIYDRTMWDAGIFVVFDKSAELSWPHDHDVEQWTSKYARLQAENSDLPPYFDDLIGRPQ